MGRNTRRSKGRAVSRSATMRAGGGSCEEGAVADLSEGESRKGARGVRSVGSREDVE